MELSQFKALLNDDNYLAFEQHIQGEIRKAEKKAIASITTDILDTENANRAKFYEEILSIPRNRISSSTLNTTKTKI